MHSYMYHKFSKELSKCKFSELNQTPLSVRFSLTCLSTLEGKEQLHQEAMQTRQQQTELDTHLVT